MPNRVTYGQVMREVYLAHEDEIKHLIGMGRLKGSYSLDEFRADMLRSGLLADPGTIRVKWDMLVATGVVSDERRNSRTGRAFGNLDIPLFLSYMDPRTREACIDLRDGGQTETETETHTQGVEA